MLTGIQMICRGHTSHGNAHVGLKMTIHDNNFEPSWTETYIGDYTNMWWCAKNVNQHRNRNSLVLSRASKNKFNKVNDWASPNMHLISADYLDLGITVQSGYTRGEALKKCRKEAQRCLLRSIWEKWQERVQANISTRKTAPERIEMDWVIEAAVRNCPQNQKCSKTKSFPN